MIVTLPSAAVAVPSRKVVDHTAVHAERAWLEKNYIVPQGVAPILRVELELFEEYIFELSPSVSIPHLPGKPTPRELSDLCIKSGGSPAYFNWITTGPILAVAEQLNFDPSIPALMFIPGIMRGINHVPKKDGVRRLIFVVNLGTEIVNNQQVTFVATF